MKVLGFHRGFSNWVARFELAGFEHIAYLDKRGCWRWAKETELDLFTRAELEKELTEELKKWLKESGKIPKS